MAHPLIRETINRRVSGDPAVWPITWFRRQFGVRMPFRRALSIGCGPGTLERDLVAQGVVSSITGIDIVPSPLELAAREAAGLPIRYERADAYEYLRAHPSTFDAIFFHASLHHFERVDEILSLARAALAPDGVIYLDEFVGPSMHEWNVWRLLRPNFEYYRLPRSARRVKLVRTPVNPEDPTEAVAAADILPAVDRHFRVLERRDYGGNLLALIYPNLEKRSTALNTAVAELIAREDQLLRAGTPSHHAILVGVKAALCTFATASRPR